MRGLTVPPTPLDLQMILQQANAGCYMSVIEPQTWMEKWRSIPLDTPLGNEVFLTMSQAIDSEQTLKNRRQILFLIWSQFMRIN